MALTKSNAEILVSRLKQRNLLDDGLRITSLKKRNFPKLFSSKVSFATAMRFLKAIGISSNTSNWRLFTHSSSRSLKAVLLHDTNKCPSVLLNHSSAHER